MTLEEDKIIYKAFNKPYSKFCLDVIDLQNNHQIKTLQEMGGYVKLFEDNFESLSSAIIGLNDVSKNAWKKHNSLQAIFMSKIPKTLFSAFQQILKGDYHESLGTCRIGYEILLAICFIAKYPESQWSTVEAQKGDRAFKPSNFLRDDLKVVKEDPYYKFLSWHIHCQKRSMMSDIKAGMERRLELNLGYGYDNKELSIAFNNLLTILYFAIKIFQHVFNDFLLIDHSMKEPKALEVFIKDMPNKFSNIPDLVNDIIRELNTQ